MYFMYFKENQLPIKVLTIYTLVTRPEYQKLKVNQFRNNKLLKFYNTKDPNGSLKHQAIKSDK